MSWQLISLIVLLVAIGTGMLWYERSRPPSQIVALVAVLAALAVAGRIVLAPIPNVVATTDIVIIAGFVLGPAGRLDSLADGRLGNVRGRWRRPVEVDPGTDQPLVARRILRCGRPRLRGLDEPSDYGQLRG